MRSFGGMNVIDCFVIVIDSDSDSLTLGWVGVQGQVKGSG